MSKLPSITSAQAIAAFGKADFVDVRSKGSHHHLKKEGHPNLLTVPMHNGRDLGKGLLAKLIKDSGLTRDEFIRFLN